MTVWRNMFGMHTVIEQGKQRPGGTYRLMALSAQALKESRGQRAGEFASPGECASRQ